MENFKNKGHTVLLSQCQKGQGQTGN